MARTSQDLTAEEQGLIQDLAALPDSGPGEALAKENGEIVNKTVGGGSGTPGGSNTNVQFNDGGVFGGDSGFIYDSAGNATLTGSMTVGNTGLTVGASTPFSDSAGTLTLQNVDALDTTTETTIESALDTLPNVTSIQGQSVTFSGSFTGSGTNTGDQNLFGKISVSGQSDVVADSTNDTLTLVAGTNVTITTDAATDSVTINASGGGGGGTVDSVVAGTGISVDNTDPANPVVSSTITQYTDEMAQDAVGGIVDATLVYVDGTPVLKRAPITGDISIPDGSNTAAISAGVIVNADINASAAIDASKIANGSVSNAEFQYLDGVTSAIQTQIDSKVTGAASSTDEAIARYDLTTGKVIQNSVVTITDAGVVAGATQLNVDNLRLDGNTVSSTNSNGNVQVAPNGSGVTDITSQTNINTGSNDYRVLAGGTGTITETATGSSTNIDVNIVPKGTGRLQESGVNVPTVSSTDIFTNKTYNAAGSDTYVQFNDGGNIGADADFIYTKGADRLTVGNVLARDLLGFFDATDTDALYMYTDEELTADRTLNIKVNDASRTLTVAGNATISGTNTGDQNLSGLVPYTGATSNLALGAQSLSASSVTTTTNVNTPGVQAISGAGGVSLVSFGGTTQAVFGASTNNVDLKYSTSIASASADYHVVAGGTGTITDTATGSSTNIDINLVPKGTGKLKTGGNEVYFAGGTDVPVADGGTGVSSLTAYAPVFGGTTSTGAVQSGTVGNAGEVLTSNGAGALPTFQAAAGGSVDNGIQDFRLTLVTGTPVMTSDQTAKTTVYLTPYKGNRIALYDGSSAWSLITSTEVSLSLSGYTANSNYDIWAYNNAGTLTLESTIWTNDTTRATALAYQDGVLVKSGTTTRRYIGTIRTTGTTGQTAFVFAPAAAAGGTAGQLFVWNYYNRVPIEVVVRDSTDSWSYGTGSWRAANNSSGNRVSFVVGVQEVSISARYLIIGTVGSGGIQCYSGIGYDSTTAMTGSSGMLGGSAGTISSIPASFASVLPSIGSHYISAIEYGGTGVTFYGDDGTPTVRQGGLYLSSQY